MGKVIVMLTLLAVAGLVVILQMTTPATIGPLGILIVFILLYVSVLGVLTFLLFEGSRIIARASRVAKTRRPMQAMSLGRAYYFSTVLALGPVILIGMQSVGAIGFYEVMLVAAFIAIGCIYVSKRSHS
jgi:hypothetical protein